MHGRWTISELFVGFRVEQDVKKRWVRWLVSGVSLVAVVGLAAWLYLDWMMKQPLYHLGDVSAGKRLTAPLNPPVQDDPSRWKMESGIELAFDAYGNGRPVIVVHGGPGLPYGQRWRGLEPLQKDFRFFFYHQRGCGDSSRPFQSLTGNYYENMIQLETTLGLGAQIADIERIRQVLGEEKIVLVGHSFGGLIATLYAAEFPDRVESLVLVAPAGVLTPPDADRNLFDLARKELTDAEKGEFDEVMGEYLDFGSIFSRTDEQLAQLHVRCGEYLLKAMGEPPYSESSSPASGGWAVFALYFSMGRAQDYRPALRQVTAPTLILVGEDDALAMAGSKTYRPIRGAEFVVVPRVSADKPAGHGVFDQNPEFFARELSRFLQEVH